MAGAVRIEGGEPAPKHGVPGGGRRDPPELCVTSGVGVRDPPGLCVTPGGGGAVGPARARLRLSVPFSCSLPGKYTSHSRNRLPALPYVRSRRLAQPACLTLRPELDRQANEDFMREVYLDEADSATPPAKRALSGDDAAPSPKAGAHERARGHASFARRADSSTRGSDRIAESGTRGARGGARADRAGRALSDARGAYIATRAATEAYFEKEVGSGAIGRK